MRKATLGAVLLVLSLGIVVRARPQHSIETVKDLDNVLAHPLPDNVLLTDCQTRNQQWETSYRNLDAQLRQQRASNREARVEVSLAFATLGAGIVGTFMFMRFAVKVAKRWWPVSKQRRQLIVMISMASWVTIASAVALIVTTDQVHALEGLRFQIHPVNMIISLLVYSLPALSFGSVGIWWFGRKKPETLWD
jgi:energy-coupling factor transporter transmembrane protein EcfT